MIVRGIKLGYTVLVGYESNHKFSSYNQREVNYERKDSALRTIPKRMVLPNIGAFIAWGLITALFIDTGWAPNKTFVTLVDPMIKYLLPLLIGYTGGKLVHGQRGGVVGAAASMGVIVGSTIPMFLGAMIMGPFAGFLMKKFDEAIDGKIPSGFEMLVNNFSAGILAAVLAIFALVGVGPVVQTLSTALGNALTYSSKPAYYR